MAKLELELRSDCSESTLIISAPANLPVSSTKCPGPDSTPGHSSRWDSVQTPRPWGLGNNYHHWALPWNPTALVIHLEEGKTMLPTCYPPDLESLGYKAYNKVKLSIYVRAIRSPRSFYNSPPIKLQCPSLKVRHQCGFKVNFLTACKNTPTTEPQLFVYSAPTS